MVQIKTFAAAAALTILSAHGLDLTVTDVDSIKSASSALASSVVSLYHGDEPGHVPGLLDPPYFWWEGGAMLDTLIQYWRLTGDAQYNTLVSQGLQFQQGPNGDFMPTNQTSSEGNDDQATWALAAMSAAESQLPEVANGTTWLALADAVFNEQVARWDAQTCGGGLRWQIFPFNTGYDYKQSLANGDFFQLAARLARHTGNSTYADWAATAFTWATTTVGLVDSAWNVFDGANTAGNCTAVDRVQFSSAAGTFVSGAAHMYNATSGAAPWRDALEGLLNRTLTLFFPDGVATEISCEPRDSCDTDMRAFKGLLAHWLVDTVQMAPFTAATIMPLLASSAQAAAAACGSGSACTLAWSATGARAGNSTGGGLGEQLSALSSVQALLGPGAASPAVTETVGGGNATSTSTSTSTGTGGGGAASGTQAASGSGTPGATSNAALGMRAEMGLVVGVLGSMAWLIL